MQDSFFLKIIIIPVTFDHLSSDFTCPTFQGCVPYDIKKDISYQMCTWSGCTHPPGSPQHVCTLDHFCSAATTSDSPSDWQKTSLLGVSWCSVRLRKCRGNSFTQSSEPFVLCGVFEESSQRDKLYCGLRQFCQLFGFSIICVSLNNKLLILIFMPQC